MGQLLRRFEVMLPLRMNDGSPLPEHLHQAVQTQFEERFGAISVEGQLIRGFDRSTGAQQDHLMRLFIDVQDTAENLAFFLREKETLERQFEQESIRITHYLIEAL